MGHTAAPAEGDADERQGEGEMGQGEDMMKQGEASPRCRAPGGFPPPCPPPLANGDSAAGLGASGSPLCVPSGSPRGTTPSRIGGP